MRGKTLAPLGHRLRWQPRCAPCYNLPAMHRYLVTGGAGFIGSHLVDRLLARTDVEVTVIDSFDDFYDPGLKRANVRPHLLHPSYRLVEADIRDYSALERVFIEDPVHAIIHLAARAGVRPSLEQARVYAEVNVAGTLNLLELTRQYHVPRFIFGSSSSVYGPDASLPFREDAPVAPVSPYAATKAAGELLTHTYSYLYGFQAVCLRFFTVYGARQRPDLAIHKFARLITERRPIPVYGDGTSERDYTFIDDIINGIMAALRYDALCMISQNASTRSPRRTALALTSKRRSDDALFAQLLLPLFR